MMRKRRLLLLMSFGLLSIAILLIGPGAADATSGGWSTPLKVSADTVGGWFPDVAADDDGTVHIVWGAEYPQRPRLEINALWHTQGSGQLWSQPNDVAVIYVGAALRNSLAVDSVGRLHLLYKGFGSLQPQDSFDPPRSLGPEDIWYTATNNQTGDVIGDWQDAHRLTHNAQGYFSDLKIDSHGVLHAIWTESDKLGYGLFYSQSQDGGETWSERRALDGENDVWWYRAALQIDDMDRLHVVWEVSDRQHLGRTRAAFYADSTDGGHNWTTVQMGGEVPRVDAANNVAGPQQPAVGVDGNGLILFVYREEATDRILFRTSVDGSHWSGAELLPGVRQGVYRPYDVYDMVTDSAGHVHLAFVGYPEASNVLSLLHSEWDGRTWSAPETVTAGAPFPEYPRLALSSGNRLHLVWFGGDRESVDRAPVGIWYSTAVASAPTVRSRSAPVPVPAAVRPVDGTTVTVPRVSLDVSPGGSGTASSLVGRPDSIDMWASLAESSTLPLVAAMGGAALVVLTTAIACLVGHRRT
jgi:hypothetical protein